VCAVFENKSGTEKKGDFPRENAYFGVVVSFVPYLEKTLSP